MYLLGINIVSNRKNEHILELHSSQRKCPKYATDATCCMLHLHIFSELRPLENVPKTTTDYVYKRLSIILVLKPNMLVLVRIST